MALPGRLRERMGALAERDARASALVHDRTYRASVAAALGLAVNATYAAGNLALGVAGASAWLVTWGCYYAALAATRLLAVRGGSRTLPQPPSAAHGPCGTWAERSSGSPWC